MAFPGTGWAAVNTQPHRESLALEHLRRQDFECYCPMVSKRVRHARRQYQTLRPLFPGYLFVALDLAVQRWRPILSTAGVRTLVRNGDRPALLAPELVAALKAREVDGAVTRPSSPFQVGQSVRIAGGALDGLVARIVEMDEKERLVVLLDLLGGPIRAKLTTDQVAEISAA